TPRSDRRHLRGPEGVARDVDPSIGRAGHLVVAPNARVEHRDELHWTHVALRVWGKDARLQRRTIEGSDLAYRGCSERGFRSGCEVRSWIARLRRRARPDGSACVRE